MTARQLTFVLFLATSLTSFSQTKLYFPNLTRVSIDTTHKVFFSYDKKFTRFINKPCYSLDKKDPLYCEDNSLGIRTVVAEFKNENIKDSVKIIYSEGLSADPEFEVTTKNSKLISRFSCIEFYINGSGTIYTTGHVNNMYERRRKYQIQQDTIVEISQPYNYVGLSGNTLKSITLYKNKIGNEIVAQIPKDYEIEILLADESTKDFDVDYNFLVKTDFGLVGWLRLTNEDIYGTLLKDLFYAGD